MWPTLCGEDVDMWQCNRAVYKEESAEFTSWMKWQSSEPWTSKNDFLTGDKLTEENRLESGTMNTLPYFNKIFKSETDHEYLDANIHDETTNTIGANIHDETTNTIGANIYDKTGVTSSRTNSLSAALDYARSQGWLD
jgi:hypothetical protein